MSEMRGGASSARKMAAPMPSGTAINKAKRRSDQRAVDKGQSAEFAEDGVPDWGNKESANQILPRQSGIDPELIDEQTGDQDDGERRNSKVT